MRQANRAFSQDSEANVPSPGGARRDEAGRETGAKPLVGGRSWLMTNTRVFFGISFGVALAAACSSSSPPGNTGADGSTGNSSSGGGSGNSSGSGSGSGGTGGCGPITGGTCPTGQHCCVNTAPDAGFATMCATDCPPGQIIVDCTTPSDCKDPASPKCCGLHLAAATADAAALEGGSPAGSGVQCVAPSACGTDSIVFCTSTAADCPTGQTCNAGLGGVKQCGVPDGG
jgi:hypothetical protein